jgi:hypothetical protein
MEKAIITLAQWAISWTAAFMIWRIGEGLAD